MMMSATSGEDWKKIVGGVGFQRFLIKPDKRRKNKIKPPITIGSLLTEES